MRRQRFFPRLTKMCRKCSSILKKDKNDKNNCRLVSIFVIYQNYMKGVFINKSMDILNHFYQNFNTVSDKYSVHNTTF